MEFLNRKVMVLKSRRAPSFGCPECVEMAEGPGFEPGLTGPEPVVLPLDDPSVVYDPINYNITNNASREIY
jgi:hypothetical protein